MGPAEAAQGTDKVTLFAQAVQKNECAPACAAPGDAKKKHMKNSAASSSGGANGKGKGAGKGSGSESPKGKGNAKGKGKDQNKGKGKGKGKKVVPLQNAWTGGRNGQQAGGPKQEQTPSPTRHVAGWRPGWAAWAHKKRLMNKARPTDRDRGWPRRG